MKTLLLIVSMILALAASVWYFFLYDKEITEGKGYGFTIGMLKEDAINVIKLEHGSKITKIILSPATKMIDSRDVTYINSDEINTALAKEKNVWQLRFGDSDTNVLVLSFREGKLIKMMRYRRAFIP